MLSNKDIRVEGGNLIINGVKHPIVQDVSGLDERTTELETEMIAVSGGVVVKRFYIENGNTTIDTGIDVNHDYTTGFVAIVSTFNTYNGGITSLYLGGVAHNKLDGTVGTLAVSKIVGIGMGESTDAENLQFSVVDDKLQLTTYQSRVGACITLILTTK